MIFLATIVFLLPFQLGAAAIASTVGQLNEIDITCKRIEDGLTPESLPEVEALIANKFSEELRKAKKKNLYELSNAAVLYAIIVIFAHRNGRKEYLTSGLEHLEATSQTLYDEAHPLSKPLARTLKRFMYIASSKILTLWRKTISPRESERFRLWIIDILNPVVRE